jgi:hypothetical protein
MKAEKYWRMQLGGRYDFNDYYIRGSNGRKTRTGIETMNDVLSLL